MKKYIFLIVGVIFTAIACSKLSVYISDYNQLTNYGKGYIWGNLLVLAVGLVLLFIGFRTKAKAT
ncbi:MAG: hypothetical protein AAGJ18_11495 [Bacteroidota bacterium]